MDIICFGFADWDNPFKTNQHHIMSRLAKEGKRVLFVESLGLRRPTFQKKDIKRIFRRIFKWLKGITKIDENLYILSPLVLPFHRYLLVRKINKFLLKWQLHLAIKKLKFSNPVIWAYIPNALDFAGKLKEVLVVYHCVDELSANPLIPTKVISDMEEKFIRAADVVIVTSPSLYQSKKTYARDIRYLPNVADFNHFSQADSENLPLSFLLSGIKPPIAGFIGAISKYKLDFELIGKVAEILSDFSFVFVGPRGEGEKAADISVFSSYQNIHFIDGQPYEILPSILKGFAVCLLPNTLNEYTRNMFPMKFFEYLSAGKPVVSTRLEALKDFYSESINGIYFADGPEDFAEKIRRAVGEDTPAKKEKRKEMARNHTWDLRMKEINQILQEKLSFKKTKEI